MMFSKMIEGLRREAEAVSASNYLMLADEYEKRRDREPRSNSLSTMQSSGLALGSGGVLGIVGLAMANQAAAFGSAGVLSSASAALAGLGTVAVGSTVLPVATVVVVGAGLVGIATIGIGTLAKGIWSDPIKRADVDHSDLSRAIRNNDRESLREIGEGEISVSSWLGGAKRLLVNSIREFAVGAEKALPATAHRTEIESSTRTTAGRSGASEMYEIEDLIGTDEGKQAIVDAIATKAWEEHGVAVTDDSIQECLAGARGNAAFSGKILDIDYEKGLVLQSLGRGRAVVHNLKDFSPAPEVGKNADVSFKGGVLQNALGHSRGERSFERA